MEASDQNEDQIAVQAELEDGVNDEWTLENKVGDDAVCAVEDEWLHLKSGVGNGNNPGSKPAMFVNPTTFDFSKDGYFDFTIKTRRNGSYKQPFWCISWIQYRFCWYDDRL